MGFDGRGHYYRLNRKALVSDYLRLDAHKLLSLHDTAQIRAGRWQWSRGVQIIANLIYVMLPGQQAVELRYCYNGQAVAPYQVHWTTTAPPFGGWRYWWLCPGCGRRCAHLYGGRLFVCRECHELTYESAQSGDPRRLRVERRLRAIQRRLGGQGGPFDPLPDKPRHMHSETYLSLCWEYDRLVPIFWSEVGLMVGLTDERCPDLELAALTDLAWDDYQRAPGERPLHLVDHILAGLGEDAKPGMCRRHPMRRTLHQTAMAAEIPVAFAREAQQEGLLRPDAGRTTRRKRYRPKLASWLAKLQQLRAAGYTWAELRAWTARRFQPEHEHERCWPAGYDPTTTARYVAAAPAPHQGLLNAPGDQRQA